VAVVGVSAYRTGFGLPKAGLGLRPDKLGGAKVWVLPNPSGLQAHYQLPELVRLYGELREAAFEGSSLRKPGQAAEA
jgi:TDG/mug DNA glycosylase family protein